MAGGELLIFITCAIVSVAAISLTALGDVHRLTLRRNPGPGLVRLAVLGSMAWLGVVLHWFADASVRGFWVFFYLVIGYAVVKLFGQIWGGMLFGVHHRVDVVERRNLPAAVFLAALTLATGLIFGGSNWGEADPFGDWEGGWYVPMTFFFTGWGVLVAALALYLWREPGRFREAIVRERSMATARGAATFTLGVSMAMTDAVSGDFFGWGAGMLDVATAAGMLVVHELVVPAGAGLVVSRLGDERGEEPGGALAGRDGGFLPGVVGSAIYVGLGLLAWFVW